MNSKFRVVCAVGIFIAFNGFAQSSQEDFPPKNWFNGDVKEQKVNGVSTNEAYQLLKGKKSTTVIVAIIDSGIDINHEDLKEVVWVNSGEIAGNGIDDDDNGFVDDVHGWNFIGGVDGMNIGPDNFEVTREYKRLKPIYETSKPSKKADYKYWEEIEIGYLKGLDKSTKQRDFYDSLRNSIVRYEQLMTAYLDVNELTLPLLQSINSPDQEITKATNFMGNMLMMIGDADLGEVIGELEEAASYFDIQVEFGYNTDYNPREIIGDDPSNLAEVGYGNNDVIGIDTDNKHGTHVAGIVGAKRDNNIGINGIANNVKIMALRAVPDGDEHDKDVANAIRYAVDNGAQIINMSFGKAYSPNKTYVDEAVKYAEEHNVLLIHAAGNSGEDIDEAKNYPTKYLGKRKIAASNWIEVGASGWGDDNRLAASFSNYGQSAVDLFAPGVEIFSTTPGNNYGNLDGTSMASPVTAGVAAMLLSYFPHLKATDVKDILMQSTRKFDGLMVIKPGTKEDMVDFTTLSVSGGVVNAYEAIKLANSRMINSK
jgi:subtilisin family serine protease